MYLDFENAGDNFFFPGKLFYGTFQGTFWGDQDFFDPLIVQSAARDNLGVKKVEVSLKMSREMSHKLICPKTKKISQICKISSKLIILCVIATRYPQFFMSLCLILHLYVTGSIIRYDYDYVQIMITITSTTTYVSLNIL